MLAEPLAQARELVASPSGQPAREEAIKDPVLPTSYEGLRWFPLPGEAREQVLAARRG